jgi:hypothetical protein
VLDLDEAVFAIERAAPEGGEGVLCLHNVSSQTRRVALSQTGPWTDLIRNERITRNPDGAITLAPYQVRWITPYV